MQVFSRYAIVWGVTGLFPGVAASPAYASMLLAWSATEVVRYTYFAMTLSGARPAPLHWLRYHAFFVLYPLGISSEAWLIWRAVEPARAAAHPLYGAALWAYVVFVYPPCEYRPLRGCLSSLSLVASVSPFCSVRIAEMECGVYIYARVAN